MDTIPVENRATPTAPPPPEEVKVRTMKSDLASIVASGGGLPRFQNVKIDSANPEASGRSNKGNLFVVIIIILAVLVLGAVVYFGYQALQKSKAVQTAPPSTSQGLP